MPEKILEFRLPDEDGRWIKVTFNSEGVARGFGTEPAIELRYRPEFVPGFFRAAKGDPMVTWFNTPIHPDFRDDWIRVDVIDADPKPGDCAQ